MKIKELDKLTKFTIIICILTMIFIIILVKDNLEFIENTKIDKTNLRDYNNLEGFLNRIDNDNPLQGINSYLSNIKSLSDSTILESPPNFLLFYDDFFEFYKYHPYYDPLYLDYIQGFNEFQRGNFTGDCDDSAFYLSQIAKYEYPTKFVIGFGKIGGHAWIEIYKDSEWIEIDSTSKRICKGCVSKYFNEIFEVEL